jgi:hypothetical protein
VIGLRSTEQRRKDALYRLGHDIDAWVATTDPGTGAPRLTPLSFLWHDETLLFSTSASGATGRNLAVNPSVQVGIGLTRDVVLVQGTVEVLPTVPEPLGDAFAIKAGFDPRTIATAFPYFRLTPCTIQVWREENELAGRWPMRDGVWL